MNISIPKISSFFITLIFFMSPYTAHAACKSAITYQETGGRYGDQLVLYYKAKLLSHETGIPLLFKPIPYSENLALNNTEHHFKDEDMQKFEKIVSLHKTHVTLKKDESCLYIVNMYTDLHKCGVKKTASGITMDSNIQFIPNDKLFLNEMKQKISPVMPLQETLRPDNKITVALHIRKGGGYDLPLLHNKNSSDKPNQRYADVIWPTRFPPNHFYIDQLKKISELFQGQPLYAHLFTDDPWPESLLNDFRNALKTHPHITFAARSSDNYHDKNVLEDFFSMAKFDCLIRPSSYYSSMAQVIGDHKVVIFPLNIYWKGNEMVIDKVSIIDKR